jgi:hypothetical protein
VITVKVLTLDSFCEQRSIEKIDLLKVDVEGFEIEVFKGAKRMLENKNIQIIAFEISTRTESVEDLDKPSSPKQAKTKYKGEIVSPTLIASLGLVLGSLLAAPPLSADMKWSAALKSGSVETVESALQPSYLNPANVNKYLQAIQLFESNNLPDYAYKYAKVAVDFNPNAFDSWKLLYYISKSTPEDKDLALKNMKRLDPKNPSVLDKPQP